MVEFALVGPLVLLLLFGMIDFGRAIFFQVELNNAAREGVRIAILASNPCNTFIGNNGCTANQAGYSGTTVCQAITNETNLVSTFNNCTDNAGTGTGWLNCTQVGGTTNCSGTANQAYVEINQATSTLCSNASNCKCSNTVITPGQGTNYATTVPRIGGNLPVQVKIVYFYRPVTPFLSNLFPTNFYMYTSACGRPEY
jgi:Flp pilus assembly protein TadG